MRLIQRPPAYTTNYYSFGYRIVRNNNTGRFTVWWNRKFVRAFESFEDAENYVYKLGSY